MNNDFQNGGMPYNNDPNMMPQQPMQGGMGGPQPGMQQGYDMNQQMQQPMYNQMPQQQMGGYPQQPMQQPQMGFGAKPAAGGSNMNQKLPLLIGAGVAGIIVFVLLISLVSTKTMKCKMEDSLGDIDYKAVEKVTFKFGKLSSRYEEGTFDFSDSDEDIDDVVDELKKSAKSNCKKSKGCTYTIKKSGKKIIVKTTTKYKKDDVEDIEDYDDFKAYKKDFDEMCDD